jgi:hypothetical protein
MAETARDRLYDRLALVVLGVVTGIALLTFRGYGLSWDDFTHSEYGELLFSFYASGFQDERAFSFVNLFRYGGGFDLLAAAVAKISPFGLFETRRLIGALIGIGGMVATWRAARHVGGPLTGLLALLLIATCPLYFGHMFMNPKDAPFAAAMALLLLGLVRILSEYPQPSLGARLVFGLGVGLAIGTRILAGFDVIAALAAIALLVGIDARAEGLAPAARRMGLFLVRLIPALLLAYVVMALVWPWAVIDPLNPFRALAYFSTFFEQPWRELYGGRLINVPDMPASYAPTLFALKLPEILLALGLTGIVGAFVAAARRDVPRNRRAVLLLIALAAILPVVVTMMTRPAMYNGIRHFVFIVPPLAVLGGAAGAWIAGRIRSQAGIAAAAAVFAIGLVSPVIEMARLHPYEYTYFNRIAGNTAAARGRYMLDYWGLSFRQASDELLKFIAESGEKPPDGGDWRVAVCGPHPPVKIELGPKFDLSWDPKGAQFAMTLGEYYCVDLPAPIIAEIKRAGVTFARVYDLRGIDNITTLLTVPGLKAKTP